MTSKQPPRPMPDPTPREVIEAAREKWPEAVCIEISLPSIYWTPDKGQHYYPEDAKVFFSAWRHDRMEPNSVFMQGYYDDLPALLTKIRSHPNER